MCFLSLPACFCNGDIVIQIKILKKPSCAALQYGVKREVRLWLSIYVPFHLAPQEAGFCCKKERCSGKRLAKIQKMYFCNSHKIYHYSKMYNVYVVENYRPCKRLFSVTVWTLEPWTLNVSWYIFHWPQNEDSSYNVKNNFNI